MFVIEFNGKAEPRDKLFLRRAYVRDFSELFPDRAEHAKDVKNQFLKKCHFYKKPLIRNLYSSEKKLLKKQETF